MIIPLSVLLATNGFIKGVVVFQVDWGMLLISAAGGVWMVTAQVVLSSEVELEPGVKVECVSKFCYLGDTLGSGGGVVEAARARVRCAWAIKVQGAFSYFDCAWCIVSYRIKGRIYSVRVWMIGLKHIERVNNHKSDPKTSSLSAHSLFMNRCMALQFFNDCLTLLANQVVHCKTSTGFSVGGGAGF